MKRALAALIIAAGLLPKPALCAPQMKCCSPSQVQTTSREFSSHGLASAARQKESRLAQANCCCETVKSARVDVFKPDAPAAAPVALGRDLAGHAPPYSRSIVAAAFLIPDTPGLSSVPGSRAPPLFL